MNYMEEITESLVSNKPSGSKKTLIILLIILGIVLIVGGILGFVYFQRLSEINSLIGSGEQLTLEGKNEEAMKLFNKALEIEPTNVKGIAGKARLFSASEDYENAKKYFEVAINNTKSADDLKTLYSDYISSEEKRKVPQKDLVALQERALVSTRESTEKFTSSSVKNEDAIEKDAIETENSNMSSTEQSSSKAIDKIHRYEYIIEDITWEAAAQKCINKGGYLVNINSDEEWNYLLNEINKLGYDNRKLYVGGKREGTSTDYYWVNSSGKAIGSSLNEEKYWMDKEPSFRDDILGLDEKYMMIYFYDKGGEWIWNDVMNDVPGAVSDYLGKIGYICEIES